MDKIRVPTIKDLQGRWRLVRVGRKGGHAPFFVPWLIKVYWEFDGHRYVKFSRGSEIERGRIKLKAGTEHALINELIEEGRTPERSTRASSAWWAASSNTSSPKSAMRDQRRFPIPGQCRQTMRSSNGSEWPIDVERSGRIRG